MNLLGLGALFIGLSGLLHFVAVVLAGQPTRELTLLVFGLIYVAVAWMLMRSGSRVLSWLSYIALLIYTVIALLQTGGGSSAPDVVSYAIVAANVACTVCLFGVLWRGRNVSGTAS